MTSWNRPLADEPQDELAAAPSGLLFAGEQVNVGVLRLADEIDPPDLVAQEFFEAVAVEKDAQPRAGLAAAWLRGVPGRSGEGRTFRGQ